MRSAVVLLLLVACHSPFRMAIERAELALTQNDLAEAARQYQIACRIDPDATKPCERAKTLTEEVVQSTVERATLACGRGEVDHCLDLLAPARRISADPRLYAIAENAAKTWRERCAAPAEPIPKLGEVRCLESLHQKIALPSFSEAVKARRAEAAALLIERAKAADADAPALASVLRDIALCTDKTSLHKAERDAAGKRMLTALAVPFSLAVNARGLGDAVSVIKSACNEINTRRPALCGEGRRLQLDVTVSDLDHTEQNDHRSVRFIAGIDRVPNPRYDDARRRLRRVEEDLSAKRSPRDQARSNCNTQEDNLKRAQSCYNCQERSLRDRACSEADGLDSTVQTLERDRDSAEYDLRNTPDLVEVDRWETYDYTARLHHYRATYSLRLQLDGATTAAATTGTLDYKGEDRPGFSPAAITATVMSPPSFHDLANDLYPRTTHLILATINNTLADLAAQTEATCPTTDLWKNLDCHLRAELYRGNNLWTPFWSTITPTLPKLARETPLYTCSP